MLALTFTLLLVLAAYYTKLAHTIFFLYVIYLILCPSKPISAVFVLLSCFSWGWGGMGWHGPERNTLWYKPQQIFWNSAHFFNTVVREGSKLTLIFFSSEVACCFVYRSHYHLAILCCIITTIINARRSISSLAWHSLADRGSSWTS